LKYNIAILCLLGDSTVQDVSWAQLLFRAVIVYNCLKSSSRFAQLPISVDSAPCFVFFEFQFNSRCQWISKYDHPTLVFPGINDALLICDLFNLKNCDSSKWACYMPGKTKVGRS